MALASLFLPLAGSRTGSQVNTSHHLEHPATGKAIEQSKVLLKERKGARAIAVLQQRLAEAPLAPYDHACLFLALGNVHYSSHEYSQALTSYTEGLRLAERHGLSGLLPLLSWSRMNVYLRMGNWSAAQESVESVLALPASEIPPAAYIFAARFEEDSNRALDLCRRGIAESEAQLNHAVEAYGWNILGRLHMARKDPEQAERAFVESFRIRKLLLGGDGLAGSLFYLADVRTLQGRVESAIGLLESATRRYEAGDHFITPTALYAARGRAALKVGSYEQAFAEFGRSIEEVRRMRYAILPADDLRLSAESQHHETVFRSYMDAAMKVYRRSGDERYAAAAFLAAEEHRQAAFERRMLRASSPPSEYLSTLAQYRRLLARSMNAKAGDSYLQAQQLGRRLSEMESRLGIHSFDSNDSHQKNERTNSVDVLSRLQKKLNSEEAVLSFALGPERSYLWCLTREGLMATELADEARIAGLVSEFSGSIKVNHSMLKATSERLFRELFKGVSGEVLKKRSWLIVPDGALLKLPFAALTNTQQGRFLIESHTLRVLPTAMMLTDNRGITSTSGTFAGFGDAIYNAADPRYPGGGKAEGELGRLPASARELRLSAEAFELSQKAYLHTGQQFTRQRLESAFASSPAVFHLAGHVVQHPEDPAQVLIATGLNKNGEQEFLAPREIMTWRGGAGLVMLSGCGSGSGSELPGLGLIGLTRSWLIAGAQTVTATYWPIEDSDSGLVTNFYAALRRQGLPMTSSTVAEALRAAQMDAFREGGWRAQPSYWAGYFVVGKD